MISFSFLPPPRPRGLSKNCSTFSGCGKLTSVTLGNTVESIGYYAFSECSKLTSIVIPNSVTSISPKAFVNCSALKNVSISENLTSIEERVFENCTSLTDLVIPNSITKIGYASFQNCIGLTSVTCYATTPPDITNTSFARVNCAQIPLYVQKESIELYKSADCWKEFNPIMELNSQPTACNKVNVDNKYNKRILNGQLVILNGEKLYTIQGTQIK